jgi:predicted ABC-type transport system involved in lysophospholipase L1 biosynthesis ATPase subunit
MAAAGNAAGTSVKLTTSVGDGKIATVSLEHLKTNLNAPVYRVAVIGPVGSGKTTLISKWVKRAKELGLKVFDGGEFCLPTELLMGHRATNAKWNLFMRAEGAQIMYASRDMLLKDAHPLFNEVWEAGEALGKWVLTKGDPETAHPINL